MAIQYLLVTYPEQRAVLADDAGVGFTNHTLMLPSDEYIITLDGGGYQPASQDVVLAGTSIMKPMVIAFTPTPGASSNGPPSPVYQATPAITPQPAAPAALLSAPQAAPAVAAAAVPARTPTGAAGTASVPMPAAARRKPKNA
jgi:hypothetical protein